jgi:hypothetical protein
MKLFIEIDDAALKAAIAAQVGQAVAALATDKLQAEAQDIINKKFDRIDIISLVNERADGALRDHVKSALENAMGHQSHMRSEALRRVISEEARKILKGAA